MGMKRHTAEQIIGKLRTAEIELAKGLGTAICSSCRVHYNTIRSVWPHSRQL
jgi:hypothetical protein